MTGVQTCALPICREVYEKLNSKRKIWAEHSVVLDEVDPAIGFLFFLLCVFVLILAPCLGRLEPIGPPPLPLSLPLGVSCLGMTKAERSMRN